MRAQFGFDAKRQTLTTTSYIAAVILLAIAVNILALCRHAQSAEISRPSQCPAHRWCGCQLALWLYGEPRKDLWAARAWAKQGRPARYGCIGCVAVMTRGKSGGHVGLVTGYDHGNPIIKSGNHNNAVGVGVYPRERVYAWREI